MAITESRLKDGTLTLGTTPSDMDFSCQVTNARINSSYEDDGDAVETLCGDQIAPGRKLSNRTLAGTVIQDWTAGATSVIEWLWDHDLEEVDFEYVPNAAGPTITGKVRVEVPAETYGGDVNSRTTSDFEWGITTAVTRTPPVVGATSGAERSTAAA